MKPGRNVRSYCGPVALAALLSLVSNASETPAGSNEQTGAPETHVLFTGTDIRIVYQGEVYPVQGVDGSSLVIKVKDKGIGLPIGDNAKKIVVAPVLMLAGRSATVTNFKHEQVYTPENDPYLKGSKAIQQTQALQEHATFAEANARDVPSQFDEIDLQTGLPTGNKILNPQFMATQANIAQAGQAAASELGSTSYHLNRIAGDQAAELHDALEVQLEIASEKPIQSPYVVVMARYHAKDDPKHSQHWMAAKAIGPIDATPRKVTVREGGLAPGFVLETISMHLYENGTEIATDLSENRASLTRDEAHEYLVIDHVSTHKTDTLPARIALTKVPEDWATRPRDESFHKTYYVKVDKDGRPVEAFEDGDCTTKVSNPYCASVLKDQLFLPALDKGDPVDSVVRIKLTKLSI